MCTCGNWSGEKWLKWLFRKKKKSWTQSNFFFMSCATLTCRKRPRRLPTIIDNDLDHRLTVFHILRTLRYPDLSLEGSLRENPILHTPKKREKKSQTTEAIITYLGAAGAESANTCVSSLGRMYRLDWYNGLLTCHLYRTSIRYNYLSPAVIQTAVFSENRYFCTPCSIHNMPSLIHKNSKNDVLASCDINWSDLYICNLKADRNRADHSSLP